MDQFVLFVLIAGAVALGMLLGQGLSGLWYAADAALARRRWRIYHADDALEAVEWHSGGSRSWSESA